MCHGVCIQNKTEEQLLQCYRAASGESSSLLVCTGSAMTRGHEGRSLEQESPLVIVWTNLSQALCGPSRVALFLLRSPK